MSTLAAVQQKRPKTALVYATQRALEDARSIFPRGSVLEVEVTRQIMRCPHCVSSADSQPVVRGDGWVAYCQRVPGQIRPKPRAWLVLSVERSRVRTRPFR
jgi:hypothetical protein